MVYNQFKPLAFIAIFALYFSKALGIQDVNQEIENLKTTVNQLNNLILNHNEKFVELYSHIKQHEITISVLQNGLQQKHAATTSGSVYVRWGRKDCPSNGTDIVYTGMGAGGHFANIGRNANPICIPHDPEVGPKNTEGEYGAVFGMEYQTNSFGKHMKGKDVPCAVCRTERPTFFMIPGHSQCKDGWTKEYSGHLMSGHFGHAGASNYLCVDGAPDVLVNGTHNAVSGYLLYGVISFCTSLHCPPYKHNTLFNCVVCSK